LADEIVSYAYNEKNELKSTINRKWGKEFDNIVKILCRGRKF